MTNDGFEISRRKTLAAIGSIGVASAGAGLGTSAYFSDEEQFEDNRLVAGSLDLKVDWEEHYSDWSEDEAEIARMPESDEDPDFVLPAPDDNPEAQPIELVFKDNPETGEPYTIEDLLDVTAVEAFPDFIPPNRQYDALQADIPEGRECDVLRSIDQRRANPLSSRARTQGTFAGQTTEPGDPLINLEDVKPGDFGELTFSTHLCDNDGYLWLKGGNLTDVDGLNTEPEENDPDEPQKGNSLTATSEGELAEQIQTRVWYDDGDNILEGGDGAPVCVQVVLDGSSSMTATDDDSTSRRDEAVAGANQLAEEILNANSDNRVGVTFFSTEQFDGDSGSGGVNASVIQSVDPRQDVSTTQGAINTLTADGDSTAIGAGIEAANEDLGNCPVGHRRVMIVVTDGNNNTGPSPSTEADNAINSNTDEIFAIGTGGANVSGLQAFARPQDDEHVEFTDDLTQVLGNLAQSLVGEKVLFEGTLEELMAAINFDPANGDLGLPLDGNQATEFDEQAGDPTSGNRECFEASTTQYFGLEWWLPLDHANEIQGDRVSFDVGFYAEQCRHNDGTGQAFVDSGGDSAST